MHYGSTYPRLSSYPEHDSDTSVSDKLFKFCGQLYMPDGDKLGLLPFQKHILESACRRRAGKWAAFEVATLVPRQSGKSLSGMIRCLFGLFVLKERIYYAAHAVRTTRKLFLEMVEIIKANPELLKRVAGYKEGQSPDDDMTGIHRGFGDMSITTKYGNSITFGSRSKGDARGLSLDLYVAEEAFELKSEQMDSILPTLSGASALKSVQLWYISSAPLTDSEVLHSVRNRGITGDSKALLFMEWSAPETTSEEELYSAETIAQANPALGYRQSLEAILAESEGLSVTGYKQERLGIPQFTSSNKVFDPKRWEELELDPSSEAIDPSNLVLTVDASPDRRYATIMAAYTLGDKTILEIIDRREGVQWVPLRLKELAPRSAYPVIYDEKSHIGSLADQLRILGVPIRAVTFDELLRATGLFFDAVNNSRVNHIGQEELTDAITTTVTKPVGTRWRFVPTTHDISPLVAGLISYYFLNLFETYSSRKKEKAQGQTPKKRRVRV